MILDRAELDPWALFIAITALLTAVWTAHSVRSAHDVQPARFAELPLLALLAAVIGSAVFGAAEMLAPLAAFLGLSGALFALARNLSVPGIAWLSVSFLGVGVGWLWSCLFLAGLALPYGLKALALIGTCATLAMTVVSNAERIAREAVLTHHRWRRPTRAPIAARAYFEPRISVHLPCYAEPPAVVMQTMDRLAAQDYADFEVLVCDNNTQDEALWRPVERHAETLNRKLGRPVFRFFHVAPLAGAKAGALNFLIDKCVAGTELVAVIDADYEAEPHFLSRLAPFFENPRVAYVQTPHDYREHEASPYLSACYAEYMPNNKIDMLGVHEYGGAFTIGTMCVLRLGPLKAVGGWAEWCLTEDSEVSVRLRAAGFHGIYVGETFGRGLIPATFDDYKKQRFRWTAGPVQQLRRHWRLFLPTPWARSLPGWTKMLEIVRCISPVQTLLQLITGLVVVVGAAVAVHSGLFPAIELPPVAWLLAPLAAATGLVRTWHRYRLSGIARIADMVRGEVARSALLYVVLLGGIAGLSSKPLTWRRTPKFGGGGTLGGAIGSALPETLIGLALLSGALWLASAHGVLGVQFAALSATGMALTALRFLCAPYMALLALRDAERDGIAPGEPDIAPEVDVLPLAA